MSQLKPSVPFRRPLRTTLVIVPRSSEAANDKDGPREPFDPRKASPQFRAFHEAGLPAVHAITRKAARP